MNITLPMSLVGAVAGSVLMVADAPPKFNVAPGCKAAAAINQSMDLAVSQDYQSCMNDEESAHEQLVQSWSKYNAPEKSALRRADRGRRHAELCGSAGVPARDRRRR
jgi:hypothetical protein